MIRMNQYKHEWMINAGVLHLTPYVKTNEDNTVDFGVTWETTQELSDAVHKTMRAIALGVAISQIDGPLPVADVVGVAFAVGHAAMAWWEFFD